MKQEIIDYIESQRVGVLSLVMSDGSVHGATLHFAYTTDPLVFYFGTGAGTRKGQAIVSSQNAKASVVVGFSEDEMKTLQMDGDITIEENIDAFNEVYLGRFPRKAERAAGEGFLRLRFSPSWWRYSDMNNKVKISSEDQ